MLSKNETIESKLKRPEIVLKALNACYAGNCEECPYHGTFLCITELSFHTSSLMDYLAQRNLERNKKGA